MLAQPQQRGQLLAGYPGARIQSRLADVLVIAAGARYLWSGLG